MGRSDDWAQIDLPIQAATIKPQDTMWKWSAAFNKSVEGTKGKRILMGYSLGGRLALHALIQHPQLWDGAILISTNPGQQTEMERQKRLKRDEEWAQRFEKESWKPLITAWDQQAVFGGIAPVFQREETHYSRRELTHMLREWSVGKQEDLTKELSSLPMPILWIAGNRDLAYSSLAKSLAFQHNKSQTWVVSDCGHRVAWEKKDLFQTKVKEFLDDNNDN